MSEKFEIMDSGKTKLLGELKQLRAENEQLLVEIKWLKTYAKLWINDNNLNFLKQYIPPVSKSFARLGNMYAERYGGDS